MTDDITRMESILSGGEDTNTSLKDMLMIEAPKALDEIMELKRKLVELVGENKLMSDTISKENAKEVIHLMMTVSNMKNRIDDITNDLDPDCSHEQVVRVTKVIFEARDASRKLIKIIKEEIADGTKN